VKICSRGDCKPVKTKYKVVYSFTVRIKNAHKNKPAYNVKKNKTAVLKWPKKILQLHKTFVKEGKHKKQSRK